MCNTETTFSLSKEFFEAISNNEGLERNADLTLQIVHLGLRTQAACKSSANEFFRV